MNTIKRFDESELRFEYGLSGIRLLPWEGLRAPFGGAYCIVAPGTESEAHVNSPSDEDELFVCVSGEARVILGSASSEIRKGDVVFIPRGTLHYVKNDSAEPFHFYALWWNKQTADDYREHSGG
jgi:oxalate decarboxylase/phosphoglucose isomerase-like protein (cupin superfamily)